MKATLHFDLNKPEDRFDYNLTNKASDLARVVWEMGTNCRKELEWEVEQKRNVTNTKLWILFSVSSMSCTMIIILTLMNFANDYHTRIHTWLRSRSSCNIRWNINCI